MVGWKKMLVSFHQWQPSLKPCDTNFPMRAQKVFKTNFHLYGMVFWSIKHLHATWVKFRPKSRFNLAYLMKGAKLADIRLPHGIILDGSSYCDTQGRSEKGNMICKVFVHIDSTIKFFNYVSKMPVFFNMCATCSELPSYKNSWDPM